MGDEPPQKAKRKIFTPPTYEEITSYMEEAGFKIDVAGFIDFYESKGWMVGKNKMKDWKSAARRAKKWECNIPLNGGANKKQRVGEQPAGRFVT